MYPFQAPIDDILFSLRHVAGVAGDPGWDDELAADVFGHFGAFAKDVIAPLNATGDAQGARFENGRVRMPDGFEEAYTQLAEAGWQGLSAPEEFGGMAQSAFVSAGVSEIFSGANHAMQMVCGLVPGAIKTLLRFGTPEQQATWVSKLASGEVLSTMCLTEPGAGSDLARIRCCAQHGSDGWILDGEKIFISGGDQDMSPQILHFVLAQSGPVDAGIKGLSLFLCTPGPGVSVMRIEEKLGLHASPTCQLSFDTAKAELIGTAGEGLRAMFTVMNHARIDVALQGVAHAARAASIAQVYAAERKQGQKADGTAACLADHADVRRMLDAQVVLAMGGRGMCHATLAQIEADASSELCEFLTSLCKVFGSEAGIKSADLGMQVLGGYGYLTEYGVEQIWRDARITSIYEGTNGIHARTLATRGLRARGGADLFAGFIAELTGRDPDIMAYLAVWKDDCTALRQDEDVFAKAHDFVQATATLFNRAIWAKIMSCADHHSDPEMIKRVARTVLT